MRKHNIINKIKTKETEIQKSILEFLALNPSVGIFWRVNQIGKVKGRRVSVNKGMPDIIGILNEGTFCAIEVKTRLGKQTEEQIDFENSIKSRGGICFVARSLDDVIKHLRL